MSHLPAFGALTQPTAQPARGGAKATPEGEKSHVDGALAQVPAAADGTAGDASKDAPSGFALLVQGEPPVQKRPEVSAQPAPEVPLEGKATGQNAATVRADDGAQEEGRNVGKQASSGLVIPSRSAAPNQPELSNGQSIPKTQGGTLHAPPTSPQQDIAAGEGPVHRPESPAGQRVFQNGTPLPAALGGAARNMAAASGATPPPSTPAPAKPAGPQTPNLEGGGPESPPATPLAKPPATSAQALALAAQTTPRATTPSPPKPVALEVEAPAAEAKGTFRSDRGEEGQLAPLTTPKPAPPPERAAQTYPPPPQTGLAAQPVTYEESLQRAADAETALHGLDGARMDRADTLSQANQPRAPLTQAQIPSQIGQQMAGAARQIAPGTIELQLYPEELGRLRIQFDISEQTLIVSISAERTDTADLMRRHIDQLAREMQTLGYRDVQFQFDGGGSPGAEDRAQHSDQDTPRKTGHGPDLANAAQSALPPPSPATGETGLDLRI